MKNLKILSLAVVVLTTGKFVSAQTWIQTGAPTNQSWSSVTLSADGIKLAAVIGSKLSTPIYISTNSGVSWTTNGAPSQVWGSVVSSADGNIFLASVVGYLKANLVYISTNGGASWMSNTNVPVLGSSACSADGRKWVTSTSGGIYTSTNFGATWTSNNVPNGYWGAVASSADGTRLAAAMATNLGSYSSQIYVSRDSGTTWDLTSATNLTWNSIAFSADGTKLAAAAAHTAYTQGAIYTSTNSGTNWTLTLAPDNIWSSIASSADGNTLVAAAPYDNTAQVEVPIYISTNAGNTWNLTSLQSKIWRRVVCSADGNKLVAIAGLGGSIWAFQTTPAPSMHLTPTDDNLLLSWIIPSTNFVLQQNSDLTTTNWTDVTNAPVLNLTNLQDEVTLPLPASNCFYRLATQ